MLLPPQRREAPYYIRGKRGSPFTNLRIIGVSFIFLTKLWVKIEGSPGKKDELWIHFIQVSIGMKPFWVPVRSVIKERAAWSLSLSLLFLFQQGHKAGPTRAQERALPMAEKSPFEDEELSFLSEKGAFRRGLRWSRFLFFSAYLYPFAHSSPLHPHRI